ncbi:IS3 family transposase, partial [Oligella urethralis]|uniref:IS3 family transposase n=2 Tax=Oligella TaxID=90243 RepID=UPI002549DDAF
IKKSPGYLGGQRGKLIPAETKQIAVTLVNEAVQSGARRQAACDILGISCRNLRRWEQAEDLHDKRQQPGKRTYSHALTKAEKALMITTCNQPEYRHLPPSQIVPKLADKGIYIASESSFYRVLKEYNQLAHRGKAQAPRKVVKPTAWVAQAPNQVWTWDITYLKSTVKGQFYRLYMIVDIYSRLIVGWEVHLEESAKHAAQLIRRACVKHNVQRETLVLHSDNGSPMKGATMLATLQQLGVMPSFSRPATSNDNPYSESLFKTLKYMPHYPNKPFADITEARQWAQDFTTWYNTQHCHSGIRYVTPQARHQGQDREILAKRAQVYEAAKQAKSERWKGRTTRNWEPVAEVYLNPSENQLTQRQTVNLAA